MNHFVRVILLKSFTAVDISIRFGHVTNNHADRVSYMNAAHQQGDNTRAMADADAERIDAADPPQLPAPRAQNSTPSPPSDASPTRSEFGGKDEDDQDSSAAGPPILLLTAAWRVNISIANGPIHCVTTDAHGRAP